MFITHVTICYSGLHLQDSCNNLVMPHSVQYKLTSLALNVKTQFELISPLLTLNIILFHPTNDTIMELNTTDQVIP